MKTTQQEKLVKRIIEVIESNPELTWEQVYSSNQTLINAETGKRYRGSNLMMLMLQLMFNEQKTGIFCTFKQAQNLNLKMKKGSKGCYVQFFGKMLKDTEGKPVQTTKDAATAIPFSRWYSVFSLDCFEDGEEKEAILKKYEGEKYNNVTIDNIDSDIETFLQRENIEFELRSAAIPCYIPMSDKIVMPDITSFKSSNEFYLTFLHEISHATGNEKRLKRKLSQERKSYASEELIAELSASMLGNEYNILNNKSLNNSSAYLKSWIDIIKESPSTLFKSLGSAQKACDYYLNVVTA